MSFRPLGVRGSTRRGWEEDPVPGTERPLVEDIKDRGHVQEVGHALVLREGRCLFKDASLSAGLPTYLKNNILLLISMT